MAELALNYGMFIQSVIDFIIIAFAIFLMIRWITSRKKQKKEDPAAPSREETLLEEIRDILREFRMSMNF